MTRKAVDRVAGKAMVVVERLGYFLWPAPFVIEFLKVGEWPSSPLGVLLDAAMACAIVAVALLMGYARRQAERVESLRRTLNEAIIHDLKNPMTAIMGCLSCVIEDSPSVAKREKLIKLALHGCRSQMALLETLVDTSRLEYGELVARRSAISLRGLLDSCLGEVRGVAAHLGVDLKDSREAALPQDLHADPDLLPRTLANLLHNAIKYTPPGGSVSLRAGLEAGGVGFEIADTGIGIPPEHIDRLFGKYYRVEGGDQASRRGSGLGLYFCRLVIEAHGGKVSIESSVGRGTTIRFNIPQPEDAARKNDTSQRPEPRREAARPESVRPR